MVEPVNYQLPYPGRILPDHPLYFLKMIRDRIWLFLTTDPLKKAEVLLHFADKRIGTAEFLIEKGNPQLAIETALKAEGYLERAVAQEIKAKEMGKETRRLLEKSLKASQKHEEIILTIQEKVEGQEETFENLLNYSRQAHQAVGEQLGE